MPRSHVRPSPIFAGLVALTVAAGVLVAFVPPLDLVMHQGVPYLAFGASDSQNPVGTAGIVVLVLGAWAVSLTLHEFGHAIVAFRGGDFEVAEKGYLTMDVRRYTDPVLSLVLPLLLLAIGGIPLPGGAVWINQWALRSRRVAMWVSLAGPLANLTIGLVLIITMVLVPSMPGALTAGLALIAWFQILAFVLNILPVPGLDGYGAIEPYLSPQAREVGAKARPWAPLVLFMLLIAFEPARTLFFGLANGAFELFGGDPYVAGVGREMFMFWR